MAESSDLSLLELETKNQTLFLAFNEGEGGHVSAGKLKEFVNADDCITVVNGKLCIRYKSE